MDKKKVLIIEPRSVSTYITVLVELLESSFDVVVELVNSSTVGLQKNLNDYSLIIIASGLHAGPDWLTLRESAKAASVKTLVITINPAKYAKIADYCITGADIEETLLYIGELLK